MKHKNRYRKAKQFRFIKLSLIDCADHRYGYQAFEVEDEFCSSAKNVIKCDYNFYDYKRSGSFYRLNSRPYRRLIESSEGKNWDDVMNYIKRKVGNKGNRYYSLISMMRYHFPKQTTVEDGVVYELENRWGGYNKVSPGDIYIGAGNIVQRIPSEPRQRRHSWSDKKDNFSPNVYYGYEREPNYRRKLKLGDDLLYREMKNTYNQRLVGGKIKVVAEYNWFRFTHRSYMGVVSRWLYNPAKKCSESVEIPDLKHEIKSYSASKKEIKQYNLKEL